MRPRVHCTIVAVIVAVVVVVVVVVVVASSNSSRGYLGAVSSIGHLPPNLRFGRVV